MSLVVIGLNRLNTLALLASTEPVWVASLALTSPLRASQERRDPFVVPFRVRELQERRRLRRVRLERPACFRRVCCTAESATERKLSTGGAELVPQPKNEATVSARAHQFAQASAVQRVRASCCFPPLATTLMCTKIARRFRGDGAGCFVAISGARVSSQVARALHSVKSTRFTILDLLAAVAGNCNQSPTGSRVVGASAENNVVVCQSKSEGAEHVVLRSASWSPSVSQSRKLELETSGTQSAQHASAAVRAGAAV
mmetsp:Transcript_52619/g.140241  ORF Transcript_52619/g.140241 Transcript_52619/m.140241 type:complete len:257 (-) Transcript_52619:946-1716(-)